MSSGGLQAGSDGHRREQCPGLSKRLGTGALWAEAPGQRLPGRAGQTEATQQAARVPVLGRLGWSGQADPQSWGLLASLLVRNVG